MKSCLLRDFSTLEGRIGLLGGTFDPIHNGHIEIAKYAKNIFNLDIIVLIPTPQNPLKESGPRASGDDRLALICEVIKNEPDFIASTCELYKQGPAYTIDTLRAIKAELVKPCELFVIIGSDNLPNLHKWKEFHAIFDLAEIVTVVRNHFSKERLLTLLKHLTPEDVARLERNFLVRDLIDISSKALRIEFQRGIVPAGILPENAVSFIKENHLYGLQ